MAEYLSIPNKVAVLFDTIRRPDGKKYTLDEIEKLTGVKASTLSRIRSGENPDPMFRTVVALARAFSVRLAYFSTDMTREEAEQYLQDRNNVSFLDSLALRQQKTQNEQQDRRVGRIAMRASFLDEEGIMAIADIIDFVLKKQGISPDDMERLRDADAAETAAANSIES